MFNDGNMNLPPPTSRMRRFAPLLLVLLSASVAVTAYLQALNYPFVSDDGVYITSNPKLAGLHLTELWRLFIKPYNPFFEFLPLRDLSYWFDMTLFGLNPSAFRLHNIILYLLCLPLVYATTSGLWRYFRPKDTAAPWAAAVVTALFTLHPSHTEAAVWVASRKDILATLFSLLALWLAVRARREYELSVPHAAATLAAVAAVMLSKILYVTVAPVIALLWVAFWLDITAPSRRRSQLLWPLAVLFLAGLMVWIFMAGSTQKTYIYFGVESAIRSLSVLGWLARLAVSPESRHFFYPVFEDPYLPAMVALGCAVLAAGTIGGVMLLRKRSLEGFALASFFLLCVSHIHLVPYGSPSLVSDRWLTLIEWPVVLLLVALSWRLKPVPRATLLLAIVLPWGFQTVERPRDWSSYEALVEADFRAYPGHYMPAMYKILAFQLPRGLAREAMDTANSITAPEFRDVMIKVLEATYAVRADAAATGDPQEAMTLLRKLGIVLKQPPVQAKWNSPINSFWGYCRDTLALNWDDLAKLFPDDMLLRYNAGLWMLGDRRDINAVAYLRAATESQRLPQPVRGQALYSLGLALMNSGYVARAEAPLRAALEQSPPGLQAHCLLSALYKQAGRIEEAARAAASCPSRAPNGGAAQ